MPAAAVIPTLKVYVKVVAVKTLVVGFNEHYDLLRNNLLFFFKSFFNLKFFFKVLF